MGSRTRCVFRALLAPLGRAVTRNVLQASGLGSHCFFLNHLGLRLLDCLWGDGSLAGFSDLVRFAVGFFRYVLAEAVLTFFEGSWLPPGWAHRTPQPAPQPAECPCGPPHPHSLPRPHSASQFTALSLSMFYIKWLPSLISSPFNILCPRLCLVWVCPQQKLASPWPAGVGSALPSSPALLYSSVSHPENPQSQACARCWSAALLTRKWLVWGLALHLVLVLHTFYPWNNAVSVGQTNLGKFC